MGQEHRSKERGIVIGVGTGVGEIFLGIIGFWSGVVDVYDFNSCADMLPDKQHVVLGYS